MGVTAQSAVNRATTGTWDKIDVMSTPFGIGIMLIVFSLNVLRLAHYIYLYESFCDS